MLDLPALLPPLLTPHKTNRLLLRPGRDFYTHGCDCPFPFRHEGRYFMTYVGHDGIGYRTGLAASDDLLNWTREGLILDRGPKGSPTEFNVALTCIVRDNALYGTGELKKIGGRYLGTYHAYPAAGYEVGPAAIGLCWSDDLRHWSLEPPFFHAADGAAWERGGLYKSWIVEDRGRFYLFYNAKDQTNWPWTEQTGVAISDDLKHWTRHPANPILPAGAAGAFDGRFASDPVVLTHEDAWVMFYFGFAHDDHARESAALSTDLLHWTKIGRTLIDPGPPGSIDSQCAHKPGIIARDGVLYHFYCAVAWGPSGKFDGTESRGITLATSGALK